MANGLFSTELLVMRSTTETGATGPWLALNTGAHIIVAPIILRMIQQALPISISGGAVAAADVVAAVVCIAVSLALIYARTIYIIQRPGTARPRAAIGGYVISYRFFKSLTTCQRGDVVSYAGS